jgi:hypothetical protein
MDDFLMCIKRADINIVKEVKESTTKNNKFIHNSVVRLAYFMMDGSG